MQPTIMPRRGGDIFAPKSGGKFVPCKRGLLLSLKRKPDGFVFLEG